jgi:hypothetical protein
MSTPFYDLASLVVLPSGYKSQKIYAQKPLTTDGQLTFTRASTATRVNASGLIETVSSGVPRLDYLGSTCPKLLLEPQRTNLYTYSEQIDNADWGKTNVSVTANNTASPDGSTNADKVVANTTNGVHRIEQDKATATQVATQSVFAKASGYNFIALENGGEIAYFNVSTGVVGTVSGGTASIQNYGNGWYRCIFTATGLNTKSYIYISNANNVISFAGDNASGVFLYGAQFEVGAYATSYIPTTSAAVTRLADAASKTGISSLIGQTEGTMFVEVDLTHLTDQGVGTNQYLMQVYQDAGARILIFRTAADQLNYYFLKGGVAFFSNTSVTTNGRHKLAFAYKSGDSAFYIDGVQQHTSSTTFTAFSSLAQLHIGANFNPSQAEIGDYSYSQALLFKTRLTNAQLAELTTL